MNKKTCYVTTPIYYASGNVHIGNTYSTIICDCFARYNRLKGVDTFFLTGMDEHGTKVAEAAAKVNMTPKQYVDKIASETKSLWKDLNISNNDFIQTTEERHILNTQKIFEELLANDDIYLSTYEGDYCVSCESFFTKTQITEAGICPDCGKSLSKVQEESYFLRLNKYQDKLLKYIKENPDFIQPETRKNEVVSFIEKGLEDLSVSRTTVKWGIEVKSNPKHTIYVWIDALSNYLSALGYNSKDESNYNKYWLNGNEVVHVVGKDILRFHAIYWPIMLMALNIPIKFKLYVHGWYLMKEGKMSKSKGNMVYPRDVVNRYGLDAMRLYLAKEMALGNDSLFSYERFIEKYNVDLANDLGNLVSRTIAMINKYFDSSIKKPIKNYTDFDSSLEEEQVKVVNNYKKWFDTFRFQNGLNEIWSLISRSNKYVDETCPWNLAKDPSKAEDLNCVLYHLYESLRLIAIMASPVMPDTCSKILDYLNVSPVERNTNNLVYGQTIASKVINNPEILFKRLDQKKELEELSKAEKPVVQKSTVKEEITIDDFTKLDIRIGEVVSCVKMEKSDKLLILKVKVEDRIRQIVSGIANNYTPEEMIGKKVVVLANLKPIKLRGELSEGMILAASNDNSLEVLEVKKQDTFSKVS